MYFTKFCLRLLEKGFSINLLLVTYSHAEKLQIHKPIENRARIFYYNIGQMHDWTTFKGLSYHHPRLTVPVRLKTSLKYRLFLDSNIRCYSPRFFRRNENIQNYPRHQTITTETNYKIRVTVTPSHSKSIANLSSERLDVVHQTFNSPRVLLVHSRLEKAGKRVKNEESCGRDFAVTWLLSTVLAGCRRDGRHSLWPSPDIL